MSHSGLQSLFSKRNADRSVFYWAFCASFMANLLGLGSSLYSIQIFNRYVGYGLDGTLMTLTIGALLAIALEFVFRSIRVRLVTGLVAPQDAQEHADFYRHLLSTDKQSIASQPPNFIVTCLKKLQQQQAIYSPQNMLVMLDLPFALLFIFCVFLLEPLLGAIAVMMMLLALVWVYLQHRRSIAAQIGLTSAANQLDASLGNSIQHTALIAFNARDLVGAKSRSPLVQWLQAKTKQTEQQQTQQNGSQVISAITSVAVIGVGAVAVTQGRLDIGSLIGANILAMRAINVINTAGKTWLSLGQGEILAGELADAWNLTEERRDGAEPMAFKGGMTLHGISHGYDARQPPVLNNFNMNLEPGQVLVITGTNGRGKTTIANIMMGLITPDRGQVLIDGIDLRQLSIDWWRQQVCYVPQDPTFLNMTLRENLTVLGDVDEQKLRDVIDSCGLGALVDQHPDGLEQAVTAGGQLLPSGIRKRLALARALVGQGKFYIFDEVQEGMDAQGRQVLSQLLNLAAADGKTVVLFSSDPNIVGDSANVFDLNSGEFKQRRNHV